MVFVDGSRSRCSRAAVASAWRSTRSRFCPASFLRSASLHPRRMSSAKRSGNFDTSSRPGRRVVDAVEVAADADVIHAGDLAHVLDVVGHLGERRAGRGVGGLPLLPLPVRLGRVRHRRADRLSGGIAGVLPALELVGHERRHERHHHHAAVLRQARQDRIGHVARMVHQGAGGRVGEDDRRFGDVEGVAHGGRRDVGQVHQHAHPVHLAHDFLAELREAAMAGAVERRIGPVERDVVRQRHVPRAERVVRRAGPRASSRWRDRPPCPGATRAVSA